MATVSNRPSDTKFFGHPFGLATLFFTEMWERFSFYGMKALLMLFMTATLANRGLGFDTAKAATIYGLYTGSVYFTPLFGGWLADKLFGARRAVLIGGIIIASGHFCMLLNTVPTFYAGLVLIAIGTGLLKPNASTMVGDLYSQDDVRRDSGFSIFYMGINLGAFIAPFICGYLGQHIEWHYGFAAAGFGMVLGLIQYVLGSKSLGDAGLKKVSTVAAGAVVVKQKLTAEETKRLFAIGILVFFSVLFFTAFEQQGTSMTLFADRLTGDSFLGLHIYSSWFQSVEPFFVITLAPVLAWIWLRMASRQPSSPAKFSLGLLFIGIGNLIMLYAVTLTGAGKVSPMWLIVANLVIAVGELSLSPVGLSTVTSLAPARWVGSMMGVWFLSISLGNILAGQVAKTFKAEDKAALMYLFGGLAVVVILAAVILLLMTPFIKKLMVRTDQNQATQS